jgi:hypothetical protein
MNGTSRRGMRLGSALGGLVLLILSLASASPAEAQASIPRNERVTVIYVAPDNHAFTPLYDVLKDQRALERVRELILSIQWPRRLTLEARGCDGEPNAFYENAVITICYELLDDIWRRANSRKRPNSVTREDALVGSTIEVFLHEASHALFDLLKIPVLGREEDAADQVSAFTVLQLPKETRQRLVFGAAYMQASRLGVRGARDLSRRRLEIVRHVANSSEHGTPAQRLYNLLCIAYGSDRDMFGSFVAKGYLPAERAEICEQEYRQVEFAYQTLIAPHRDAPP